METDLLVIGGNVAGRGIASSVLKKYPETKITIVRKQTNALVPCGIPYIFGTLNSHEENAVKDKPLKDKGVNLVVDEVKNIDRENKTATTATGAQFKYKKLIFATGSVPFIPCDVDSGRCYENVFYVNKDLEYLAELKRYIIDKKNIVIVGGGFIGVELADEISKMGEKDITIVEKGPGCLWQSFDEEFTTLAEQLLREKEISVRTSTAISKINGDLLVQEVELTNGEKLAADVLIFSVGARPNTALAAEAGLELDRYGAIVVDRYMRAAEDIIAVGDCAAKRDFFTGGETSIMLASVAATETKIAANNLYKSTALTNKGTISIVSTHLHGMTMASAGLTLNQAQSLGFEVKVGKVEVTDRHPGVLPGASKQIVKLLFDKATGVILAGQVTGGSSAGEMVNIIGVAIQNRLTAADIVSLQMATHPMVTAGPTLYPITNAAENTLS